MNRTKLARKINKTAVEKGWWETKRNHDEIFMLVITELAEAVEADRKDRRADKDSFNKVKNGYDRLAESTEDGSFKVSFEETIKDTLEDELADAWIRCMDYLFYRHRDYLIMPSNVTFNFTDNFAQNIFFICKDIADRQIKVAVFGIEQLAEKMDIDLEWHIKQKMKYNDNRDYKHGGKKY